ncbi:MAG: cell division protein ZapA [Eubacterium sp.]|nr:cell division protein ZapA [Eubacterium sp.]MDY5497476.1 cell division protein ZapA [Anaerobutyricum sp.]
MEEKKRLSVVIDNKVYLLSGGSEAYLQKLASYVDGKIRELKKQPGYSKLSQEYRDILLALNLTEEIFKMQDEREIFQQDHLEKEQEIYRLKQDMVDKTMRLDNADKLVEEYKKKVNELQKQIIELETGNGLR